MILRLAANPSVDRLFEIDRLVQGGIAEMPEAARLDPDRTRALASQAEVHLL
jgi:hypothetical protein